MKKRTKRKLHQLLPLKKRLTPSQKTRRIKRIQKRDKKYTYQEK